MNQVLHNTILSVSGNEDSVWAMEMGREAAVSIDIKAKASRADEIPSGFTLEGCQKWPEPGDLGKYTTEERGKGF